MAEITFPKSWHTISDGAIEISCLHPETAKFFDSAFHVHDTVFNYYGGDEIKHQTSGTLQIRPGYYDNMKELIDEMNSALERQRNESFFRDFLKIVEMPVFRYNHVDKHVSIELPALTGMKFPPRLASVLGFDEEIENTADRYVRMLGYLVSDITGGVQNLFVYCDILQNVLIGDTEAPLLRIVHAEGKHGEMIVRHYDRPQYVPVQRKQFDTIGIYIRSDLGENILFENGKVTVTLHFKKVYDKYFS